MLHSFDVFKNGLHITLRVLHSLLINHNMFLITEFTQVREVISE